MAYVPVTEAAGYLTIVKVASDPRKVEDHLTRETIIYWSHASLDVEVEVRRVLQVLCSRGQCLRQNLVRAGETWNR